MNCSNSQVCHKAFSKPDVSDQMHIDASAGCHQRLVREQDGRFILIIRTAEGFIERRTVHVFEGSVIA